MIICFAPPSLIRSARIWIKQIKITINNGLNRVIDGVKSYGKRNAITGGTCLGSKCSSKIMARSTIAAGYCGLMKKERISIHLLKNHLRHCKDVLRVETLKRKLNWGYTWDVRMNTNKYGLSPSDPRGHSALFNGCVITTTQLYSIFQPHPTSIALLLYWIQ